MPPRRSTRGAMSSSLLFDGSSEAGGPLEGNSSQLDDVQPQSVHTAVGRGMSPGPAKYSSAYGSPPTILPTRQNVARQRYNFSSALSHVVDAVEQDNENDARERAQREAEQQQRLRDAERAQQAAQPQAQTRTETAIPPPVIPAASLRPTDETLESVELVREHGDRESEAASASESSRRRRATRSSRSTETAQSQAREQQDASEYDFAAEEQLFTETQIFTPVVPARTKNVGVVSKTSNILQNILNSARRISTATTNTREEPDEDAIRQAYPQFTFIRPRSGNLPADTNTDATAAEPARTRTSTRAAAGKKATLVEPEPAEAQPSTTATPNGTARAAKSIKSRIATPGPGFSMRNRKSLFKPSRDPSQDELASNDNDVETVASARSLLGRRRTTRAQSQPVSEERPRTASVESDARKPKPSTPSRGIWGFFAGLGKLANVLAMLITLVVLGTIALRVFVISTSPAELYKGYRVDNRLRWYGNDWRSNLRQLVPFALMHPLGAISDEEFARMNGLILSHANEIAALKQADRLHDSSLERIGRILPHMVHMDLDRHGRPVIAQEFWHALKDNMKADKDIFTLIWNKDGSMAISDIQLTAVKRQLQSAGLLADPNTKALSIADVEGTVTNTVSKSFESWLRQNQKKVQDILGVHAIKSKEPAAPSPPTEIDYSEVVDRLSESQVAKLAHLIAASPGAKQVLVSRQEFLQHLQNSFVEHRLEIKGEIADLETQVVEAARVAASALSLAQNSPAEAPPSTTGVAGGGVSGGMTKAEVSSLVHQLVRRIISDTQLEAMARGKIKAHWDADLIQQVNFFTQHHGATINHHFSSPTYEPKQSIVGKLTGGKKNRLAPGRPYAAAVFLPWEQDGDCWCGATKGSARGGVGIDYSRRQGPTDVAIKLGLRILPQFLVLEHISQSATLDAGATPRDLEVWIQITDYAQQRPLQDWSMSQFPDTDEQDQLFGYGFVKVGEFSFEANGAKGVAGQGSGEAQIFRLSPDLETLDAITDHIVVRAVSNHGNQDHTCFYRLRMYGQHRPDVVE